jgi:glutaredoxin-like YruB-family protein
MQVRVQSLEHLKSVAGADMNNAVIGFFGSYSEKANTAQVAFAAFCEAHLARDFYLVDTATVKDIHPVFGIKTVPAVIKVRAGRAAQGVFGVAKAEDYLILLDGLAKQAPGAERKNHEGIAVTIYSTPSCSWCVKVKGYLRGKGVRFTDIDVSRDASKAQELMRKTGQTGVPQLNIGGRYVVGFDKKKIDALLGL